MAADGEGLVGRAPDLGEPVSFADSGAMQASGSHPTRDAIEAALKRESGNIAAAARSLGLHRTQLYRLMKRHGITPGTQT